MVASCYTKPCRLAVDFAEHIFTYRCRLKLLLPVLVLGACTTAQAQSSSAMNPKIAWRIAPQVQSFALQDVRLLDGPFRHAQELDRQYLLSLDADRLLHGFRTNAGLQPKAPLYGGWESQGIAGHTLGHYLTALAEMWASTGDAQLKERLNYIVAELALCQETTGTGYIGAIPDGARIWGEIEAGKVKASGFNLNGGWVPWYTQHKIFAGLRDAYRVAGNAQARDVLIRFADWAIHVTRNLDEAQWQQMLRCEHGGMNEVLADVYALTGQAKYLELAHKFSHRAILEPLSQKQDKLDGLHANTQIPKVIGFERLYELEGDPKYGDAARFFWQTVTQNRSFAIGGNSDHEHFFAPDQTAQHLSSDTAENCNVYNMLRLTRALYQVEPSAHWMEFYERALFNQILSSQDPVKGGFNYLNSLKPGSFKVYSNPTTAFWCCVGSGMENHAKYGESIYFHQADALYVNLFIASKLNWAEQGVTLTQNTRFPDDDTTLLTIHAARPARFALKLRHPAWAKDARLLVNGQVQNVKSHPGSYETLAREWRDGDEVTWQLPMRLHSEALTGSPQQRAILYGPIVLAGDLGREGLDAMPDYVDVQTQYSKAPTPPAPALVSKADWEHSDAWHQNLERISGSDLAFQMRGLAQNEAAQPVVVKLIPFSRAHHIRYNVYWNLYSPAQWQAQHEVLAAREAAARDLAARTMDEFRPGEQQSEIDHNLQSERSQTGDAFHRKWRDAGEGGFFAFDLKLAPDARADLVVIYWGGESGDRRFDILADGERIASQTLQNTQPGAFFDATYSIPHALTRGKSKITIRFQSQPGAIAGGIFGARTVRRDGDE